MANLSRKLIVLVGLEGQPTLARIPPSYHTILFDSEIPPHWPSVGQQIEHRRTKKIMLRPMVRKVLEETKEKDRGGGGRN